MLKAIFSIHLQEKILPGKVAIGKFDGRHPCLVAVTPAEKVLLHDPQYRSQNQSQNKPFEDTKGKAFGKTISPEVTFLNFNQTIKSITTGSLKPDSSNDLLVIGTPTSMFVYDVENNTDVFYKDIPDGANVVVVGKVGNNPQPMALSGGNSALQGFDMKGEDVY